MPRDPTDYFTVTPKTIAGRRVYIVAGPHNELRFTSADKQVADLDCRRLNAAYKMGLEHGRSPEPAEGPR